MSGLGNWLGLGGQGQGRAKEAKLMHEADETLAKSSSQQSHAAFTRNWLGLKAGGQTPSDSPASCKTADLVQSEAVGQARLTPRGQTQQPTKGVHPAFQQRVKAARRARWASLGRWSLLLGIPLVLGVLLVASPVAAVRQGDIRVDGIGGAARPDQVNQVLSQYIGVPLIRLNTAAVVEELEQLAGVKGATVTRSWPTGLSVQIVPRVVAAAVADGDGFQLFDEEGVELERVTVAPEGLPQVVMPLGQDNRRALRSLLGVVASLPPELTGLVAEASASSQDTVTLRLTDGVEVVWGDSSEPGLKAAATKILVEHGATWIDVTAPEQPVTR